MPDCSAGADAPPQFTPSDEMPVSAFRQILWLPLRRTLAMSAIDQPEVDGARRWVRFDGDPLRAADHPSTPGRPQDLYAHYLYFHPYIRRFLFDLPPGDQRPLTLWRLRDPQQFAWLDVVLPEGQDAKGGGVYALRFRVERCLLYEFSLGLVLLELELVWQESRHPSDGTAPRPPLSLAEVMDTLDFMRRTHPGYFPWAPAEAPPHRRLDLIGGRFPLAARWSKHDHFMATPEIDLGDDVTRQDDLLKRLGERREAFLDKVLNLPATRCITPLGEPWASLLGQVGEHCEQIEDERMPYMAYVVVDDPARIWRGDWVRLASADYRGKSAELPYGEAMLHAFEQSHCYDRFFDPKAGLTTRYLNTGYAFAMVGANIPVFTGDLLVHFRRHYASIGLLAQFNKAALLLFSNRLSEAIETRNQGDGSAYRNQVRHIQGDLLEFTHRYWFDGVSNQLQAGELQAMWFKHLRLNDLYAAVMAEARAAHDYVIAEEQRLQTLEEQHQSAEQRYQTVQINALTEGALYVAVLGLILAAMGAGFPIDKPLSLIHEASTKASCWVWAAGCTVDWWRTIPGVAAALGAAAVSYQLCKLISRARTSRASSTKP